MIKKRKCLFFLSALFFVFGASVAHALPLHNAIFRGDTKWVIQLLARGADLNAKNERGESPLYLAAENDHADIVRILIDKGADVNAKNENGERPLHGAAGSGHADIVRILIDKGADVNAKNKHGYRPLHHAAGSGYADIVRILIDKGADVSAKSEDNERPLHTAARSGRAEIVKILIDKGADVNAKNKNTERPLHGAIQTGLNRYTLAKSLSALPDKLHAREKAITDTVLLLLKNGADINAKSVFGYTALRMAVDENTTWAIQLLIEHGADVNAQDEDGFTPLHTAARNGLLEAASVLLDNGATVNIRTKMYGGHTPLYFAVRMFMPQTFLKKIEIIKLLIKKGADVNVRDRRGDTPLHVTIIGSGPIEIIRILIENGADVSAVNRANETPLSCALSAGLNKVEGNSDDVIDLLIQKGANISGRGADGVEILRQAVRSAKVGLVKRIVANGADISAKDANWLTLAAKSGNLELVEFFVEKGMIVSKKGGDGYTPLHGAASSGSIEVVNLLLKKGADTNAKTKEGVTPLLEVLRSYKNSFKMIMLLIDNGAEVDAKNEYGDTPLHLISYSDSLFTDVRLVKLLKKQGRDVPPFADGKKAELIRLFISKGINVNVKNKSGQTPLHQAAREGDMEVVRALLENGADVNARDENNSTPLHSVAPQPGHRLDIVKVLIENGADVNIRNKNGDTADILAEHRFSNEIKDFIRNSSGFKKQ